MIFKCAMWLVLWSIIKRFRKVSFSSNHQDVKGKKIGLTRNSCVKHVSTLPRVVFPLLKIYVTSFLSASQSVSKAVLFSEAWVIVDRPSYYMLGWLCPILWHMPFPTTLGRRISTLYVPAPNVSSLSLSLSRIPQHQPISKSTNHFINHHHSTQHIASC